MSTFPHSGDRAFFFLLFGEKTTFKDQFPQTALRVCFLFLFLWLFYIESLRAVCLTYCQMSFRHYSGIMLRAVVFWEKSKKHS